jgi:hypothetical protein
MQPLELCPQKYKTSEGCRKQFCQYRNNKGQCSLDFEPEDKEYEIGFIADTLQISRQRVWRIYDVALSKLKNRLSSIE